MRPVLLGEYPKLGPHMVVVFPDSREKPAHIIRDRGSLRIEMQDRPPMVRTPLEPAVHVIGHD